MKVTAAFLLVFLAGPGELPSKTTPALFRYSRTIAPPGVASNTSSLYECAPLDAEVFAHTSDTMSDLRLFDMQADSSEVPYVITLANASGTSETAHILDLGLKSDRRISLDLKMPGRPYSSLDLRLKAQDFIASATLSGLHRLHDKEPTYLGTFTLFDLTGQRLGRNTHLEFAESTFPYLHLELGVGPAPPVHTLQLAAGMVSGADVPASRLAQIPFTPVFTTSKLEQQPRRSVATFEVPAHVPIERVRFELDGADQSSFSRDVRISARPSTMESGALPEELSGEIRRVHLDEAGREIRDEALSIPAVLGSNAQSPATIQVAVENGDDRPLHIRAVHLEMRPRELCFYAAPSEVPQFPTLFYGASGVSAPVYDLGRLFDPAKPALGGRLGPERENARYAPDPIAPKPFTERHPAVLWVALLAVAGILGVVAFRSAKKL